MHEQSRSRIADRTVGGGFPVFIIGEIGINHNGSVETTKALIDCAAQAGVDAVKFQKRTPELCVPREQWGIMRDTPWGRMSYLEYRHRMEFTREQFEEIDAHCRSKNILWFASCWDEPSVDFMEYFEPPCYKAASASLTDIDLLRKMKSTGRPLIMSTGMSTLDEIREAVAELGTDNLLIAHATSAYPCAVSELNLRVIPALMRMYPECPIGYSGHEEGVMPTIAAVSLGATFVERHITLDRSMWGSDQSASVEPGTLVDLVRSIREVELSLGDGFKRVYPSEIPQMQKLRRVKRTNGAAAVTTEEDSSAVQLGR
jgi:N-acetylneuraminate synthase